MTQMSQGIYEEPMDAHDPQFSLLAARAAIEIDSLLQGKPASLENVVQLGEELRQSSGSDGGEIQPERPNLSTLSVLGMALEESTPRQVSDTSVGKLAAQAWDVARELTTTSGEENRQTLERLRAFCVALSRSASAYRSAVLDESREHPFRR
jgi:hypothetical protein